MGKEVASLYATLGIDTSKFNTGMTQAKSGLSKLSDGFKSLTGISLSTTAIIAGVGKALQFSVNEAIEAEQSQKRLETVLKSTKYAAGLTKDELMDLATEFSHVTVNSEETIQDAEAIMLTFTKIGRDVFPTAIKAAMNLSAAFGSDLTSAVMQVGKALNDPNGMAAMKRVGVSFSDAQIKMANAMFDAGDIAGYQKLVLGELETEVGGMAEAMGTTYAGQVAIFKNSLGELGEAIGTSVLPQLTSLFSQLNMIDFTETFQSFDRFYAKIYSFGLITNSGKSAWITDQIKYLDTSTISWADYNQEVKTYLGYVGFMVDGYGRIRTGAGEAVEGVDLLTESTYNLRHGIKAIPQTAPTGITATGEEAGTAATNTTKLYTSLSLLSNIDTNFGSNIASALGKIKFKEAGGGTLQGLGEGVLTSIDAGTLGLEIGSELATSIGVGLEAVKVQTGEESAYEARRVIVDTLGLTWAEANTQLNAWLKDPKSMTIDVNFRYNTLMNNSSNGVPTSKEGWEIYLNRDFDVPPNGIGRATGGPVWANHDYMVGEKGVEMFRPTQNGTIIPNNKLGAAGQTVNFYGDAYFDVADKNIADDILKQARLAV